MRIPTVVVLAMIIGCGFVGPSPDEDTPDDGETTAEGSEQVDVVAAPASIGDLSPRFETPGPFGAAPRKIIVRFDRDVVAPERVDVPLDGPLPSLEPPVPGTWRWLSPDRLVFEPTVGFAPATTYRVRLVELPTRWGVLTGDAEHRFDVPAFTFSRVARGVMQRHYVDVDILFTGPVSPDAADAVSIYARGRLLPTTPVESGRPNRVRLRVDRGRLPEGETTLKVRIADGARSAVEPSAVAPPAEATLTINTRVPPMQIRNVRLREADSGYFIDVICHDSAVGAPSYWWDRTTWDSYEVSERCVLSKDALEHIQLDPAPDDLRIAEGNHGFRIFGSFRQGPLDLRITSGAFTEDGGTLRSDYHVRLQVGPRTPKAQIVAKQGRYLPRDAWGNLPVRHLNTDALDVTVRHVPPENLVFWMSDTDESATERTSDLVATRKIQVRNPEDREVTTWIDVADLLGEERAGLFEIRVDPVLPDEDTDDLGLDLEQPQRALTLEPRGDVRRLVLSDIHLIAKEGEGSPRARSITVFAVGARDGEPLRRVEVDLVRPSGFVMASCTTSSDGACTLDLPDASDAIDPTSPMALVARRGDDLTYLKFSDVAVPVSEEHVAGEPWSAETPYTASLYADRGVYRPGDTVRLAMVLRDAAQRAPADLPVTVTVYDPRMKQHLSRALTLDPNGMATLDVALPPFATTGSWRAWVEVGGEEVEQHTFAVEEFVPERMKVETRIASDGQLADEPVTVDVKARYLFGASAEGSRVELRCSVQPHPFRPPGMSNFRFGPVWLGADERPAPTHLPPVEARLDADGEATLRCGGGVDSLPQSAQLVAEVAVFEGGGGRTTRSTATVPLHPETFYIGLDSAEKAEAGQRLDVAGVVVDWEGKPLSAPTRVELVFYRLEEEFGWWWYDDGASSYDLHLRRAEIDRKTVETDARGRFEAAFTPDADAAGYLVRAVAGKARTDFRIEGSERRYAWGDEERVDRTPKPHKPTSLRVEAPDAVHVGERATATIHAPFDGRMLVTLETDSLLRHEWRDVKAGEVRWDFEVPTFVPNVYVSALLIKDPSVDSPEGYAPERAFGVQPVRVEPTAHTLDVALTVPAEVRSNSRLPVEIDLGKMGAEASITVAAVDEGILQLTDFQSPDPLADIFAQRRLGVTTYETIGWSMLMPAGPSRPHGGGSGGAGGRVQAVKPVALWSGRVRADADGRARVELDVPQYRGKLRVMAVAATADRMGSADAAVLVRDPLVLQTTLPRFLVQGDTFQVPVFVTNLSGKDRDIAISMTVEDLPWPGMPADPDRPPPVRFLGADRTTVRVAAGESRTVAFQARAEATVGAARFEVRVESDGLESRERLDVPFAPSGPKERRVEQIALTAGKLDLAPHLRGWLPTTERTTFWVTPNPYAQAMGHLQHLIHYPYGCIEQTTSSTRPLLYVRDLLPQVLPEVADDAVDDMIQHGVSRVLAMQTSSGGFGYWPGDDRPTPWGSVYATHLLLDARAKGHAVPQERLDDALDWIERFVRSTAASGAGTYRHTEPYAHYVLALAKRPHKARALQLIEALGDKVHGQDAEDLYLLQAALYLAGDRRFEKTLREPDVSEIAVARVNSWSFYSDLRRRGLVLSTYHDLFGNGDTGAEQLARKVAASLANTTSSAYTTQELAWGITGLGKRSEGASKQVGKVTLLEGSTRIEPDTAAGSGAVGLRWAVPRASERALALQVDDRKGGLFLVVNSEGIREGAKLHTGGKGLRLSRAYLDAEGRPYDVGRLELGDVIYTRVRILNTGGEPVQNIALVDRFASGWEIENPRLNGPSSAPSWVDPSVLWDADYMNVRDDRLELFGTLGPNEQREVVYALRAVTAGTFQSPPVEAEAMYDPSIWAREPGPKVVIAGPWDDVLL